MLILRSSRALHNVLITPPNPANRKSLFQDFVCGTPKPLAGTPSLGDSSFPLLWGTLLAESATYCTAFRVNFALRMGRKKLGLFTFAVSSMRTIIVSMAGENACADAP
jgi:hypothetical protein